MEWHAAGLYIYVLNVETQRRTFSFVSERSDRWGRERVLSPVDS